MAPSADARMFSRRRGELPPPSRSTGPLFRFFDRRGLTEPVDRDESRETLLLRELLRERERVKSSAVVLFSNVRERSPPDSAPSASRVVERGEVYEEKPEAALVAPLGFDPERGVKGWFDSEGN